ncbi:MAG: hypothetical protein ABIR36_05810, partial [Nitrospiraceae bacterium]
LEKWVEKMSESDQTTFARKNYFPENIDLGFKTFMTFFQKRKELLKNELKNVLALTNEKPSEALAEWNDRDERIEPQEIRIAGEPTE